MGRLGIDDATERWQRLEQHRPVPRGRQTTIEHRDDAAVAVRPDQTAGALRQRERRRGEIDLAEAVAAVALDGLAAAPARAGHPDA